MSSVHFTATLSQTGNNTGIEVPSDLLAELGAGKRPAVKVDVNGYRFQATIASMGGRYLIAFSSARRAESGIMGGDAIDVTLALDDAPRTVDEPADLRAALDGSESARTAWDALSYSRRKEYARSVADAKKAETRARRVAAVLDALT